MRMLSRVTPLSHVTKLSFSHFFQFYLYMFCFFFGFWKIVWYVNQNSKKKVYYVTKFSLNKQI